MEKYNSIFLIKLSIIITFYGGTKPLILNPEEYAKVCKCSLQLAEKRCSYFNNLYIKLLQVVCPSCKADYTKLQYNDDGKNEDSTFFIVCIACNNKFSLGDSRLRDWVASGGLFDQVLDVIKYGKSSVMGFEYGDLSEEEWIQFVTESTKKLYNDDL